MNGEEFDWLDHPQFPARFFGHALWGPHRLVHDVDAGVGDSGQREQVVADVSHHVGGHRTPERGQRHLHVDALRLDRDVVDEAQVDDVDRDLGVEALAEHFDHVLGLDRGVRRDPCGDRGLSGHGFSSGRPASRHAFVPPRKLTTSLTPSATAISDATAERSPTWQTKIVPSLNDCAVGFARSELSTTYRAPTSVKADVLDHAVPDPEVHPDHVPAKRVVLFVADVGLLEAAIVPRVLVVVEYVLAIELVVSCGHHANILCASLIELTRRSTSSFCV